MLLAGCRSLSAPELQPVPAGLAPWVVPPDALGTRRLYRLSYEGPEASGSARLVLELAEVDSFVVRVFDRLGRKLWEARSEGDTTLVVTHEAESFCRVSGAIRWRGLEDLGPLEPAALPALLLGRVPGRLPQGESMTMEPDGRFRYVGAGREVWTGVRDEGGVVSWILRREGEPRWWWIRSGGGGILSQKAGRQVRWDLVAVEALDGLLPLEPPLGYGEECADPGAGPSGTS